LNLSGSIQLDGATSAGGLTYDTNNQLGSVVTVTGVISIDTAQLYGVGGSVYFGASNRNANATISTNSPGSELIINTDAGIRGGDFVFGKIDSHDFLTNQQEYSTINELNNLLIKIKPNLLLETSIWPETYSYTLTLSMITQLPILSLIKSYEGVIKERLSSYDKSYYFSNADNIFPMIKNIKQDYFYTIDPTIYFNSYWDDYFITNTKKKHNLEILSNKYYIKPYVIYFPQFHNIHENNISFYNGFTDMENLDLLKKSNISEDIEEPLLSYLNIESNKNYNLENKNIIQNQINLICDYNISGFAIYYYWFSKNTITNKNTIMEKVFDQFFHHDINMRDKNVFFIWANEDWSGNPAFGATNQKIENDYSIDNIEKNTNLLMSYFHHMNYLKIDNKPVFFIYHPWFLTDKEIDLLYLILDNKCKLNNFNGIHIVLNSMEKKYDKYTNFYMNFNYKKIGERYYDDIKKQLFLDYEKYTFNENNFKDCIQTIVYDFDNRARLFKPNKLNCSTICINNTDILKKLFTKKTIEKYKKNKKSDIENILLINAFNEWGEKMTLEPSKKYENYNLNLLTDSLQK
jgi:hypothetical protein